MTTGITTCAEHHLGRAIPNLDDGNQIMWQLLREDIVESPGLTPVKGRLSLPGLPGLTDLTSLLGLTGQSWHAKKRLQNVALQASPQVRQKPPARMRTDSRSIRSS